MNLGGHATRKMDEVSAVFRNFSLGSGVVVVVALDTHRPAAEKNEDEPFGGVSLSSITAKTRTHGQTLPIGPQKVR